MHITLETDYAIRIVTVLAQRSRRMDAKSISEATAVSLRFALKILRKLVAGGLIKSHKGTQGGYELAKSPEEISLHDVIVVVEGDYFINRCLGGGYICTREKSAPCRIQRAFADVTQMVKEKLKEYTFDQFIRE